MMESHTVEYFTIILQFGVFGLLAFLLVLAIKALTRYIKK